MGRDRPADAGLTPLLDSGGAHHRGVTERPHDLRTARAGHTADLGPRPREHVQPDRAGRRSVGARSVRRLGRARPRGSLPRRRIGGVRRGRPRRGPRDRAEPRQAPSHRCDRAATRSAASARRRSRRTQEVRSRPDRPALRSLRRDAADPGPLPAGRPCGRRTARLRDERAHRAAASTRAAHIAEIRQRTRSAVRALITAICPGSYDPVTFGHVDVIKRATGIFDRVVVGVVGNPHHKAPMFTLEERVGFLREALADIDNVEVDVFRELVVDFARKWQAKAIVKGLRVISDFEWEFQMNQLNRTLAPEVETVYVMARPTVSFVSSSGVTEIAAYGGREDELVPKPVAKRFAELFPAGRPGTPENPTE